MITNENVSQLTPRSFENQRDSPPKDPPCLTPRERGVGELRMERQYEKEKVQTLHHFIIQVCPTLMAA